MSSGLSSTARPNIVGPGLQHTGQLAIQGETAHRSGTFAVFQHQSVGPRHFVDAINDSLATPSFGRAIRSSGSSRRR